MNPKFRIPLTPILGAAMLLPAASYAQFDGKNCVDIPTATTAIPAPGSGTITVEGLTKYGIPAKSCSTVAFSGSAVSYDYTATMATRYNNAKFPSSCAGAEYSLNGGPSYSATTGNGKFNLSSSGITGTMVATSLSQTENLTLTAGGASFVINTGLLSFKSSVTYNADQSVDIKICTPRGGVPATVNGTNFTVPTNIWKCLAQPTATQSNVRITYEEGC